MLPRLGVVLILGLAGCCPGPRAHIRGLSLPMAEARGGGGRVEVRLSERDLIAWPPTRDRGRRTSNGSCSLLAVEVAAAAPVALRLEGIFIRDPLGRTIARVAPGENAQLPWHGLVPLHDADGKPLPVGRWVLEAVVRHGDQVEQAAAPFEICPCVYY
jgi:hypothetical protein